MAARYPRASWNGFTAHTLRVAGTIPVFAEFVDWMGLMRQAQHRLEPLGSDGLS